MSKNRGGLGRGLDALLGGAPDEVERANPLIAAEKTPSADAVVSLRLSEIDPNRDQPRRRFSEDALGELAASIRSVGVIQPILVHKSGRRYVIIAGERRWRAARLAGLTEIPAIVRDWDEVRRLEAARVENLQRDDLNPIEEATGVNRLMEQCGLTQEAAAERLGRSRSAVANLLRLLTLPEPIRHMLEEGALTSGHARALIPLPEETQLKLAAMAVEQGWSVRQMEKMCAQLQQEKPAEDKPKKTERDPEFVNLERMARDVFGARAELNGDANRGKLVIHYQSSDDLQRIWEMLELMEQNQA